MRKPIQGFGLTEVLISLALSSIIMLALVNHYLTLKQQHQRAQSMLDQTVELELVIDFLRDRIRHAGFTPCLSINKLITYDHRTGRKNINAIEINSAHPTSMTTNRMSNYFYEISTVLNPSELLIKSQRFKPKQTILIADCYYAEVHEIIHVLSTPKGQIVTLKQSLHFAYEQPIYIAEWLEETFFIQRNPSNQLALFYKFHRTDELTPSVRGMSFLTRPSETSQLVSLKLERTNAKPLEFQTNVRA